jgi:SAM-dependent methyltransferase
VTDFAAVDTGEAAELVAMMDATDAWPAVTAARRWVLDHVELDDRAVVVDAGCGPGTFGAAVAEGGAYAVDIDRSAVMARETRERRMGARVVMGDVAHLPVRDGAARLVRAERVLQWTADPAAALVELLRVTAPGGWLAITDTDWGTLTFDHLDVTTADRLITGALTWVPHPRLARQLPSVVAALGARDVCLRRDTVSVTAWNPDDPAQRTGPPGLPLRDIGGEDDVEELARRARAGLLRASLTIVTVLARRA